MIKSELISRIAGQNSRLYAKDIEKTVNTILDEIAAALVRSDRVELRGFGTFAVRTDSEEVFERAQKCVLNWVRWTKRDRADTPTTPPNPRKIRGGHRRLTDDDAFSGTRS